MTKNNHTWFLLENASEYKRAFERYEQVKRASKGSAEHREKRLLAHLISLYEYQTVKLQQADPIELIKYRMEDLNLKAADLEKIYPHKSNISKVLSYKRKLSISMIRIFSEKLKIPAEALIKKYSLKS